MKLFQRSLRAKITLAVILPVIVTLFVISGVHNARERQLFEDQLRLYTMEVGEVMSGSLQHALLSHNDAMVNQILSDVGKISNVQQVQILDMKGKVIADSLKSRPGTNHNVNDPGCYECHHVKGSALPNSTRLESNPELLRVILPISTHQNCANCSQTYSPENNLGLLLIDISMVDIHQHLLDDFHVNLAILVLVTVLVVSGMYYLLSRWLIQRLEAFHQPLAQFAAGDLAARIRGDENQADELSQLAITFNRMAQELERHIHERVERSQMRQQVIIAERERIARELHDSLAQLLGFVKTKASAVRLNLENNQIEAATKNMKQLEDAAQDLLMDVREAILNLKMSSQISGGLSANLDLFSRKYARFSGLPVDLTVSPDIDNLVMDAEVETQLMRIVQESLSNIRKHAEAQHVWLNLDLQDSQLILSITDDGRGFDPERTQSKYRPSYGLAIMRERAESIGAQLLLKSNPNEGTNITLQLRLNGGNHHAYPGRG